MYKDLKEIFWWNNMKKETQQVKAEHQRLREQLQPEPTPKLRWERNTIDFEVGLSKISNGNDAIWVVVDSLRNKLPKSAYFLAYRADHPVERLAKIYIKEFVRLHSVPMNIVSDRDNRFVSQFWKGLHRTFGTKLNFGTAFHPQIDGQSFQILENILRTYVIDMKGSREAYLPLVDFAYNNSYQVG